MYLSNCLKCNFFFLYKKLESKLCRHRVIEEGKFDKIEWHHRSEISRIKGRRRSTLEALIPASEEQTRPWNGTIHTRIMGEKLELGCPDDGKDLLRISLTARLRDREHVSLILNVLRQPKPEGDWSLRSGRAAIDFFPFFFFCLASRRLGRLRFALLVEKLRGRWF